MIESLGVTTFLTILEYSLVPSQYVWNLAPPVCPDPNPRPVSGLKFRMVLSE